MKVLYKRVNRYLRYLWRFGAVNQTYLGIFGYWAKNALQPRFWTVSRRYLGIFGYWLKNPIHPKDTHPAPSHGKAVSLIIRLKMRLWLKEAFPPAKQT